MTFWHGTTYYFMVDYMAWQRERLRSRRAYYRQQKVNALYAQFDKEHGVDEFMRKAGSPLGVEAYVHSDRELVRINVIGRDWRQKFKAWAGDRWPK